MAVATGLLLLSLRTPKNRTDPLSLRDFGITGRNDNDVSQAFQEAIDAAANNGGGTLRCPSGLIWAKGLAVPDNITIEGAGVGATTLKLPDGANTDLIQQPCYTHQHPYAGLYFGLRDITLEGNKANNTKGSLVPRGPAWLSGPASVRSPSSRR